MNAIITTNIILAVVISACSAAGLTDEQLAQIFNETPDRDIGLSETRGDYASLQDISDLDQTLSSLLANSDDTSGEESIFDDVMMSHQTVEPQNTLDDIVLDAGDDGYAYDNDDDLDIAFIQQNLVTTGGVPIVDTDSDMQTCLFTYNQNHAFCTALLNKQNTKYRDDRSYCTTESCLEKLALLFKRNIKRGGTPLQCRTMGCKITQYVKKSFCNRYQCGGRRKKNYNHKMSGHYDSVYPALTNVNVFGGVPMSQMTSSRSYNTLKSAMSRSTDTAGRNVPMCGSSTECAIKRKMIKKVKGRRRKGKKEIEE